MYGKHCLILCASVVICHTLYKLLVLRRYFWFSCELCRNQCCVCCASING